MNSVEGVNVPMPIVPNSSNDVYPTHYAIYGLGGYRSVDTLEELNILPIERLEPGCMCYVVEESKEYRWNGNEWVEENCGNKTNASVYVTTFGVPTYLSWESGSNVLDICGCNALDDECELRLFRYKRRRNGGNQGRTRHHGWRDCTSYFLKGTEFKIVGTGDVRRIERTYLSTSGKVQRQSPSEYHTNRGDMGLSLDYHCAFAIFRNGQRVSDFMHFRVDQYGVYGSW